MLRVPGVLKLPGNARAGTRVEDDAELLDLLPTLAAAIGLELPASLPGRDLLTTPGSLPPSFYSLVIDGRRLGAVRLGQWKLIVNHRSGRRQLFDLETDPTESRNLADARPERVAALHALIEQAQAVHAPGWHIRACGCATDETVELSIWPGESFSRAVDLEPDDVVSPSRDTDGALQLSLKLPPEISWTTRAGLRKRVIVEDQDEVVLTTGGAPRLRAQTELHYALGNAAEPSPIGDELALAPLAEAARVSPAEPVLCEPDRRLGSRRRATSESCRPHLRIWWSPPPERVPAEAVEPELRERLRALGYAW
jgi:hypothetical protein